MREDASSCRNVRLQLAGRVQGVGFRPHLTRLAQQYELTGWVANSAEGVVLEIEGHKHAVDRFLAVFDKSLPVLARIDKCKLVDIEIVGHETFKIRSSIAGSDTHALVMPDVATCNRCLSEIADRDNRRFRYPFICCTDCGPRYSVIQTLPYDRANTTMRHFRPCAACQAEYDSPEDRRYHAQTNACSECGPRLSLVDSQARILFEGHDAVLQAASALRCGQVVGLKGLGGFQLLADARNTAAVERLRASKHRPEKPFAIMAPDMKYIENVCEVSSIERSLLLSAQAPIVLLQRRISDDEHPADDLFEVVDAVAPNSHLMGCMLPGTPLHHLLMLEIKCPVVATSGNVSGQPLAYDEFALQTIGTLADCFLTHDRAIACPLDDSVVRVVADRALLIRCARGYSPITLELEQDCNAGTFNTGALLALGGHQKSTVAALREQRLIVGPHRGDLNSMQAREAFEQSVDQFNALHAINPIAIACDKHPDYYTTMQADSSKHPVIKVQHHLAHIVSCMNDNALHGAVLGVAWDGSGYGPGNVIGGGEFITVDNTDVVELARLKPFALPGAERAVVEPRRSALGALYELFGDSLFEEYRYIHCREFTDVELGVLESMLRGNVNAPLTSSVGRFFDVVASLLGLIQFSTFEGQAAMAVEQLAMQAPLLNVQRSQSEACTRAAIESGEICDNMSIDRRYALRYENVQEESSVGASKEQICIGVLDWRPTVLALLGDLQQAVALPAIAWQVHRAMADAILLVARAAGLQQVVLSGGCFQNRLLLELTLKGLRAAGYQPFWHKHLPTNDGSLSVGQVMWASRLLNRETQSCA